MRRPAFAWDTVVLAGGRGSRLGGVRKAELEVGGARLVDRVLAAVRDARAVVVVGEDELAVPPGVLLTREDPPFAGPAAALAAGFALLEVDRPPPLDDWVMVLGCDLPGVGRGVPRLLDAAGGARPDVDAVGATTDAGSGARIEWVTSIVRARALQAQIACLGADGLVDASMRRLLGDLRWTQVRVPDGTTDDIDTWQDHERWTQEMP